MRTPAWWFRFSLGVAFSPVFAGVAAPAGTMLCSLAVVNAGLTPYAATAFAWGLMRTPSLHTLDLSRNRLTSSGCHSLCEGLRQNPTVTNLVYAARPPGTC